VAVPHQCPLKQLNGGGLKTLTKNFRRTTKCDLFPLFIQKKKV